MADESQELRHVSWTELFSFTHIFKSFRMAALSPSKLFLAFAAIVLIYLVGGILDGVWGWFGRTAQVGDVYAYYTAANGGQYDIAMDKRQRRNEEQLASWRVAADRGPLSVVWKAYRQKGGQATSEFGKTLNEAIVKYDSERKSDLTRANVLRNVRKDWQDVWDDYVEDVNKMLEAAADVIAEAEETAEDKVGSADDKEAAEAQLVADTHAARRALWAVETEWIDQRHRQMAGQGLFCVTMAYEHECIAGAFSAVRRGNFFGGFDRLRQARGTIEPAAVVAGPSIQFTAATGDEEAVGLAAWLFLALWGPIWLFCTHWVYAIIFGLAALAIWAVGVGAIARMAAVHAAREETISIGQAVRFSLSKFFSFFTAPLVLPVVIGVLGIILGVGGLIMAVWVGDLIMSVLFFVALILGVAITFLGVGFVAGLPLMYPVIAVEGSDSFDAISRSMTYVFQRPWRYGLYSLVAAVYGTVCYLFVRLCAFGALLATWFFVSHGLFSLGLTVNDAPELADGATKMDLLWTRPTFTELGGPVNSAAMSGYEGLCSLIIRGWVYVVIGMVAAFVVSFAVCSFTNIYYLLRRKVDATDLDDVYIEEPEEEEWEEQPEGEAAEAAAVAEEEAPAAEAAPAVEEAPPAEQPPAGGEEEASEGETPQA